MTTVNEQKQIAASKALEFIEDGMTVGLGTGSTAAFFIEQLADKIELENWHIRGVATSFRSEKLARELGIDVVNVDDVKYVDVTVDGADVVDPQFSGIKGGGAALLFEKVVAKISKKNIWIVDNAKLQSRLHDFNLPIEVVKFGSQHIFNFLEDMGLNPTWRSYGDVEKMTTDSNNYIIDAHIADYPNLAELANELDHKTGVVEHGIFMEIADMLVIGDMEVKAKNE
ncbi:MAG: ribose-5-phosphate isomerase RpiA [Lactobacillaceae bacterium]|jgi:ribose 5-phosphate isomerase|nr:ribose-5-phosphate isomerase RpiA [Lactobacillaceae bacterium]